MPEFNPYREWLGIESGSKPTYYQLLGIPRSEADAERIKRRAKAQIERLLAQDVKAHGELRVAIITRIKRAANCLVDAEQRRKYDQRLLRQLPEATTTSRGESVPTKPRADAPTRAAAVDVKTSALPARRPTTSSAAIASRPMQVAEVLSAERRTGRRGIARELKLQRKQSQALLICIVLGTVSLLGLGFLLATQTELLSGSVRAFNHDRVVRGRPIANAKQESGATTKPASAFETPGEPATELAKSSPRSEISLAVDVDGSADEPAVPPTAEELRELGRLLAEARGALTERNIEAARGLLARASPLARRPQDKSKHERLGMLTDYVEGYWKAAREGLGQVQSGEELTIQGSRVMIVEKTDDELILRRNGQNTTYALSALPPRLLMFFAERWFEGAAASTKVYRGAMMAVSPEFDKERVRELWRAAQRSGEVDLGDLELVLEDTYDLVP